MSMKRAALPFVMALTAGSITLFAHQQRTATISGIVVTEETPAAAVRRARVSLVDLSGAQARTVFSDDNGRFVFDGLAAGRFVLSAAKGGYLKSTLGALRPGGSGIALVVESGSLASDVTLKMTRGAVITGTLRDGRGAPVPNTTVRVQRYGFSNGARGLVDVPDVAPSMTDDRGVYRIFGLPEGAYLVFAVVGDSALESQTRVTTAERLQRARQLLASPGMAASDVPSMAAPAVTYTSTYYPGTASVADALEVRVGAGDERAGIDLPLLFVRTVEISGVVLDPVGAQAAGARVWMRPADGSSNRAQSYRFSQQPVRDGAFTVTRVPPGDYVIGAEGGAQNSSGTRALWARLPVSVNDGNDQTSLELRLQPGSKVSGRIAFEPGERPAPNAAGIRIRLFETGLTSFYTLPERVTNPDGSFVIDDIAAARYRIDVAAPSGWMLHSISGAGRDLADVPLEIRAGQEVPSLTITFTSRTTVLTGAVQDSSGGPVAAHTVVVFSADRAFWTPQSRRIRTARPAEDGRFSIANLPAGEYRLAAVRDVEDGQWFDPQFLSVLVGSSFAVTIADGQRTVQDVVVK